MSPEEQFEEDVAQAILDNQSVPNPIRAMFLMIVACALVDVFKESLGHPTLMSEAEWLELARGAYMRIRGLQ